MESKIVLITGCSSGLGQDMAERMTQYGYTVVATARNLSDMEKIKAALKLPLDVTSSESITSTVNKVVGQYGKIDVLINNAGFAFRCAVEDITDENIQHMFDVNVFGIIRMIREVVPHMRKQQAGRIINISSIAGKVVLPVSGAYCASKFALEALSDALRLELAPFGISVIVVEPGNIKTNFMKTVDKNSDKVISDPQSAYYEFYKKYNVFNDKSRTVEALPEEVTQVVQKAVGAVKPKARYMASVPAFNSLIAHCSDTVKDRVIKSLFKIE